jgi:hypothetical protein
MRSEVSIIFRDVVPCNVTNMIFIRRMGISFSSEGTYESTSSPTSVTYIGTMWFKIWKIFKISCKKRTFRVDGILRFTNCYLPTRLLFKMKTSQFLCDRKREKKTRFLFNNAVTFYDYASSQASTFHFLQW